jgi:hypothetical protein
MMERAIFTVAWTRTLTGEKGFVGKFTKTRWYPVAAQDEAARMSRAKADSISASLNEAYVCTHAYVVEAPQ